MSVSGTRVTADRSSSAHLGATLRSVLVAPTAGFEAARRLAERRARKGESPAEGFSPYVLGFIGGGALMLLWLKLSALLGLRDSTAADFRWGFLAVACVLGAMLALAGQFLWGWTGSKVLRARGTEVRAGDLRMVWGAAAFPQVIALVLLLPADALVVGPEAFTSARLEDPVSSAWAALSIALAVAMALWSLGLLAKGWSVIAGVRMRGALLATLGAGLCLAVLVVALRSGALALMETLS